MHRACIVTSILLVGLPSQVVTSTITALTPITTQVAAGAQFAQASQPAGTLPASGFLEASTVGPSAPPFALVGWDTDPNTLSYRRVVFTHQLLGFVPSTMSVQRHEMLVHFAATAAVPIHVELWRWSGLSVGAPTPEVAIDLGNDGNIDIQNLPSLPEPFGAAVVLGPAGYDVRVIMTSTVQGPGFSATSVDVYARADNALDIALEIAGCAPLTSANPVQFAPQAVFADHGVDLLFQDQSVPSVVVLGLGLQPVLLPPISGSVCLLTPSPDVLLAIPWSSNLALHLPLPAAVRPLTLRTQAVGLSPLGLVTTDAYRVNAF